MTVDPASAGVSSEEYRDQHNLGGTDNEATKDEAGVSGGAYADPDANPAFHGDQPGVGQDGAPEVKAYEEDTPTLP